MTHREANLKPIRENFSFLHSLSIDSRNTIANKCDCFHLCVEDAKAPTAKGQTAGKRTVRVIPQYFVCCREYIQNNNINITFQSPNKTNLFWSCIVGVYECFIAMYKTLIKIKRGRGNNELNSCCIDYTENLLIFITKV